MPHIVLGDPSQREALRSGNKSIEDYLGVFVREAPNEWLPGQSAEITLVLMYWPDLKYVDVVPGATFTVREGANIVGFGQILTRHD
jgi:hypothetical protein